MLTARTVIVSTAACAAAVCFGIGATSADPAQNVAAAPVLQPKPAPASVTGMLAERGVVLDGLTQANGTAATGVPTPRLSPADAVTRSRIETGTDPKIPAASVSLASLSTPGKGRELETNQSKPSRIAPMYQDRQAWVVSFDNVPVVAHGPYGSTPPADVRGTLIVAIDAQSGAFLYSLLE